MTIRAALTFTVAVLIAVGCAPQDVSPAAAAVTAERGTAPVGQQVASSDTVLVIANTVRADRRDQFERYMESFRTDLRRVGETDPAVGQAARQFRVLNPTGPDADGNYQYLFVMDPMVSGVDYDMSSVLARVHPEGEVERRLAQYTESLAAPARYWRLVE